MAALIDGITYAKKGWYWKISEEKRSEIGYNSSSSKESGEARKIVRNKKKLHREDKLFCAIFEGSKAIEE